MGGNPWCKGGSPNWARGSQRGPYRRGRQRWVPPGGVRGYMQGGCNGAREGGGKGRGGGHHTVGGRRHRDVPVYVGGGKRGVGGPNCARGGNSVLPQHHGAVRSAQLWGGEGGSPIFWGDTALSPLQRCNGRGRTSPPPLPLCPPPHRCPRPSPSFQCPPHFSPPTPYPGPPQESTAAPPGAEG